MERPSLYLLPVSSHCLTGAACLSVYVCVCLSRRISRSASCRTSAFVSSTATYLRTISRRRWRCRRWSSSRCWTLSTGEGGVGAQVCVTAASHRSFTQAAPTAPSRRRCRCRCTTGLVKCTRIRSHGHFSRWTWISRLSFSIYSLTLGSGPNSSHPPWLSPTRSSSDDFCVLFHQPSSSYSFSPNRHHPVVIILKFKMSRTS